MKRVLVIAHREELIYQAVGHAKAAGLKAGIEMGSLKSGVEPVVVATVQTLVARRKCKICTGAGCPACDDRGFNHRMEKFDPWKFEAVIIDEAHHSPAKTWRQVIKHFRQNDELKLLMVTATPQRSDGIGMWNVVDTCAYEMALKEAICEGWLCPIRQRFIEVTGLDLSRVTNKPGGDLKDGELERAFLSEDDEERDKMLHEIARPSIEQANGRPLLIFAAGVQHAHELTAACNAYDGVNAECVVGDTDKAERKRIIERYKTGETNVLAGCGVFTEGFDAPATEVVAMARPTKSLSFYLQCIGRGTRPLPGVVDGIDTAEGRREAIAQSEKPAAIILDFVGNSGNHKLVSVADALAGEAVDPHDLDEAIDAAKDSQSPEDMEELLQKAKEARERREKLAEEAARKRVSTQNRAETIDYSATDVDLFGGREFDPYTDYTPERGGASPAQVNYLIGLGMKPEHAVNTTKNQASGIINERRNRTGGEFRITGGKHRGKRLADTPRGYQDWIVKTDAFKAAKHVIKYREKGK